MIDRIRHVIIPVCKSMADDTGLPMYSPNAVVLLACTVATESFGGRLVHQIGGPAVSEYQIEWIRYTDVEQWLSRPENIGISNAVNSFRAHRSMMTGFGQLHGNFALATAYARIAYYMKPDPIPPPSDIEGVWQYYKRHWNTEAGAATRDKFMADVNQYMPNLKAMEDLWI